VDGIALLIKPHSGANAQFAAVFGEKCGVNGEFGLFWVRGRASKLSACWNDEWDNGHAHSGMVAERLMESAGCVKNSAPKSLAVGDCAESPWIGRSRGEPAWPSIESLRTQNLANVKIN
jgi:hypothetical protein